jgi:hypothetical protein
MTQEPNYQKASLATTLICPLLPATSEGYLAMCRARNCMAWFDRVPAELEPNPNEGFCLLIERRAP